MKISYGLTVCNEHAELENLITFLSKYPKDVDEIVIVYDQNRVTPEVLDVIEKYKDSSIAHPFDFKQNFLENKNYLNSKCTGDYIFQIDADEYPHESLITQLPVILEANPENEVYLVPRVNTVEGLTNEHIQKWGWNVNDKNWINWPDYQWRVWKNKPEIKWVNKVHEKLSGHKTYAALPDMEGLSLYHPKKIDRQEKQNAYYNTL